MQPDGREALFDAAKESVKPGDCERWSYLALQHHAMAAPRDDVGDLRAEWIKPRANCGFRVCHSSVDDITYYAFGVQPAAYCVGFHSNSNQIVAAKAVQSFVPANSHASILRFLAEKNLDGKICLIAGGFYVFGVFCRGENVVRLW